MSVAVLYLCATPIGNLEDVTLRVARVLGEVAHIYAEDTRHAAVLLGHLGVKTRPISCHGHNEAQRAAEVVELLRRGESVAYISDAGMPGISDPGARLAKACISAGLEFTVLPGASAALAALVLSGLPAEDCCFVGFLPREGGERRKRLASLARHPGTLIIYESPQRAEATCRELFELLGNRPAALCRELTKLHEEALRGTLGGLAEQLVQSPPRGECVLVVGGMPPNAEAGEGELKALLERLLGQGLSAKDAAKQASAMLDVPRGTAYELAVELKNR